MDRFGSVLNRFVRLRYTVVTVALFAGSMVLVLNMGQELFPSVDTGQFTIYVRLPSGTRIERTEEKIEQIEQVIVDRLGEPDPAFGLGPDQQEYPDSDLQMLISNIGVLMDWPSAYTPNTGPMDAFMLVQLKERAGRPGVFSLVTELRRELEERFRSVEFAFAAGAVWSWNHFGLANLARQRERESIQLQAELAESQIQDRIAAEVAQAYHRVQHRQEQIEAARAQVRASADALGLNFDGIRGETLRPIEAQQAIDALAAARQEYVDAVVAYNRAQFELLRAIGQPPPEAPQ